MAYGYDDYLGYGGDIDYEDEEEAIVLDRLRRRRAEQEQVRVQQQQMAEQEQFAQQQQMAQQELAQQPIQSQGDTFQSGSPQLEDPQQGPAPVSTKPQFDETRSLEQYLAETPEGQRRFTNIPGYGEDTFLMKERPLEPPAALGVSNEVRNQAPYGVDPYKETQRIAAELQAQGQEPDIEKIYTDVIDDLNRQDENIQVGVALNQAMLLKQGGKTRTFADRLNEQKFNQEAKRIERANIHTAVIDLGVGIEPELDLSTGEMIGIAGRIDTNAFKVANMNLRGSGYELKATKEIDRNLLGKNKTFYNVTGIRRVKRSGPGSKGPGSKNPAKKTALNLTSKDIVSQATPTGLEASLSGGGKTPPIGVENPLRGDQAGAPFRTFISGS